MRQNSFIAIGITGVVIVIALALFMNNNVVANLVAFTQIDAPTGSDPEATVGDTLIFIAGSNMAIEGDAALDTITFTATLAGSGATVALDLGDDDVNESAGLNEIAVTPADTNSIFTESSADKLLIDPANNWPSADTADALSANPSDCSANQFANAIIASGNLACAQPNFTDLAGVATDAQIPNDITIDLATNATNLAADPSDCAVDTKADAIDAQGDLTCTAVDTGDIANNTILPADLSGNASFADEECITFEATGPTFEGEPCGGVAQNLFETINIPGSEDSIADSPTDTLNLTESAGINITGTASSDTINFAFDITEVALTNDAVWVGSSGGLAVESGLPNCTDTGGNHLNYTQSTNVFSCGTTSGLLTVEEEDAGAITVDTLDFGAGFDISESPSDEANITFDILEISLTNDSIWVGSSGGLAAVTSLPDCTDSGGNHLNYTQSSNSFSCGTSGDGFGDLQETYDAESAPALITQTDALGGITFNGDLENAEPILSLLDDSPAAGDLGLLLDNNDEASNEESPRLQIRNSTSGAGDTQFTLLVNTSDAFVILGDDDSADLTIDSSGGLAIAGQITEAGNDIANDTDNLGFFAATTSLQLLGVISDEVGSGALVFGTSPTITTSLLQSGDVADAGFFRLQNAAVIGWEAAPSGTDITLTVDASEIMQASGTFNAATLTEGGNAVANSTEEGILDADVFATCDVTSDNLVDSVCIEQNAGTDISADLEEEDHAAEHAIGAGDEVGFYGLVDDEGTPLTPRRTINFIGAGVSCVDDGAGAETDCTITTGGGEDLQATYDLESAPALITLTDALGGFILNGDAEVSDATLTILDDSPSATDVGILLDNDDEGGNEDSPGLRFADSTSAGGDNQFTLLVTGGTFVIQGDDNATDITVDASGNLDSVANITATIFNADTGFQIGGTAASGNFLRGNATNFVSSTIQASDLGSGYIDGLGDFAAGLCGTNEILEDQGGSWGCISTPTGVADTLQDAYNNDTNPILVTLDNTRGGIILEGDVETADSTLTIRDSTVGKLGLVLDNDDEAANEASPILRLINSTSGAGDTQFSLVVNTSDAFVISGDDDAADLTIDSSGNLAIAGQITEAGNAIANDTDTLDFFSATTSAELATVISNETGTGLLVYSTNPVFTTDITTPVIISGAGDPADAGVLRLGNAELIAWEAAPASTDITLTVDASEIMQSSGTFNAPVLTEGANAVPNSTDTLDFFSATSSAELATVISNETGTGLLVYSTNPIISTSLSQDGDVADAGYFRLQNASVIGWEAAPAGTDITLTVDSSEIMQASGTFNAGVLTEATNPVPNDTDTLDFFAATTSGELATVLSNETGTGLAVFNDSPTFTTFLLLDNEGQVRFEEGGGGTEYIAIVAPASITSNRTCVLEDDSTPFDSCITSGGGMTSFDIDADNTAPQTITNTNTALFLGGTNGIDTVASATDTITFNFDAGEVGAVTWLPNADLTWTFDIAGGGTNPTLAFAASSMELDAHFTIDNQQELRLKEGDGGGENYVGFGAPATVTGNGICTLLDSTTDIIPDTCVGGILADEEIALGTETSGGYAASTGEAGGATSLEAGALDALTEIASALCGTNEILEDQGASWVCISTPSGSSQDLQQTYDNESAPALITITDALGGILFNGDAETSEATFTILDDVSGQVGMLIDNDDEGSNEASPILRIANSTSGAGDTQFDLEVDTSDAFTISGDDGAPDLTIDSSGNLAIAGQITEAGNPIANDTDTLDFFAATSSAELATVISNETGTGLLVYGTNPIISTSLSQDGDVADAGYFRLQNAAIIGWEAAPAGTDITLTVDSSEIFQFSAPIDVVTGYRIGGAAASATFLRGDGTNFVGAAISPSDLGSGYIDALGDLAAGLCGTNEILEDQGASWACISTPTGSFTSFDIDADNNSPQTITNGNEALFTGGAGILTTASATDTITIATASGETDFLASGALTCGASTQGQTQVHTTPLQYCDNAGTPALQYAAYGASDGDALAGDSATAFFDAGQIEAARGGTGDDTSATTGVARVNSGNWTYDADISHLATSSSADLLGVLSDETGGGLAVFGTDPVITFNDDTVLTFGTGGDVLIDWSTADASNHALVLGLGAANAAIHFANAGDVATDWILSADTDPQLFIHSDTTPATDYLRLGNHDGTLADIDVVGGTTLQLQIGGTNEAVLTASALDIQDNNLLTTGTVLDALGDLAAGLCGTGEILEDQGGSWACISTPTGTFVSFDIDADNNSPQTITTGNEALFVGGLGIDTTAAATDQITFDFDAAEIGTETWLDNADRIWTFDIAGGGTNPTLAFAASSMELDANFTIDDEQELRLKEEDGGGENYVGFKAPAAVTGNGICTLLDSTTDIIPDTCVGGILADEEIALGSETSGGYAASTGEAGGATSLEAGALDALTEIASALCATNEILEDQGGSWACIATPVSGMASFNLDGDNNSPQTITNGNEALIAGGAGILTTASATDTVTIATASGETDFLASGALTCGSSTQGQIQTHTTPLQYCDNAGTPALQYAAYGASDGDALAGDSASSFFDAGTIENTRGGTGDDTSGSTGVAQVTSGNWTYDAAIVDLASSTSADLLGVLSDETGGGLAVFGTDPTITFDDDTVLTWGTGGDVLVDWSTADASNHAFVIGLGTANAALHLANAGDVATDWTLSANAEPQLFIHNNAAPITDYLRIGNHDGTTADIDLVGGTTLQLQIGGTDEITITSSTITFGGVLAMGSNNITTTGTVDGIDLNNPGDGIVVSGSQYAIDLNATIDGVGSASNLSGLEFTATGELALLQGCADNQILKWDETPATWNCETDASGGSSDLQGVYNNESAPALIVITDALGGIQFNGDAETAEATFTILDDVAGQVGILIDNDDEGSNEASPILRLANSTSAGGDTQFDLEVDTSDAFTISGDDGVPDLTIDSSGNLILITDVRLDTDLADLTFGAGQDVQFRWSTADASAHAFVLAAGTGGGAGNAAFHFTNVADQATDWILTEDADAQIFVHSDTTPATDYIRIGPHDGTTATIDAVGATTLNLDIASTTEIAVTATESTFSGDVVIGTPDTNRFRGGIISKGIIVEAPTSTEDIGIYFTDEAITIISWTCVLVGTSTPTVAIDLRHSTDRNASGNDVDTATNTCNNTTTPDTFNSGFEDATIPADSYLWFESASASGTITNIHIQIVFTVD